MGGRSSECLLYSFLVERESRLGLARRTNRKLLFSPGTLPVLRLYFAFLLSRSSSLSRTDLERVIGLHGDARDKRKEGRRDGGREKGATRERERKRERRKRWRREVAVTRAAASD